NSKSAGDAPTRIGLPALPPAYPIIRRKAEQTFNPRQLRHGSGPPLRVGPQPCEQAIKVRLRSSEPASEVIRRQERVQAGARRREHLPRVIRREQLPRAIPPPIGHKRLRLETIAHGRDVDLRRADVQAPMLESSGDQRNPQPISAL